MILTDRQKEKMTEYGIPGYMHGGIIRFYEHGIPPGHFLTAFIDNDLKEVLARADDVNIRCLKAYGMWFYNQAPSGTWGRAGSAERWLKTFREAATAGADK